jgi:DNA replication and repair protein RecF
MSAMRLTGLTVRNFRNLASLDLTIPPDGMVVLGANGHGKTNLLEAIYYLVLARTGSSLPARWSSE